MNKTLYVGQTPITGGVIFHYVDPNDQSAYPVVESIFMRVEDKD